ncbi:MAG: hypothetical protein IKU40_11510 [Clostridia bacterium]|nr:hypothetical protein [Clostridia bacterium]
MTDLPFLIFDRSGRLHRISGAEWIFPEYPDFEAIGTRFLHSLRAGDRKRFLEFCATPLISGGSADDLPLSCEIFSPSSLPSFRYAFCEKNMAGGQPFTAVFLAEDMGQFYSLMSSASLTYAKTTERILREVLLLAGNPEPDFLMPDSFLALRLFPNALYSLMQPGHGKGFCDIFRITETAVRNLQESPQFLHTALDLRPSETDPSLRILEFSAELYVHVLVSLLTALMTLSADHTISLDVAPFAVFSESASLAATVTLSATVREPEKYRSAGGSLRSIAVPDSAGETLTTLAAVLAYTAGFETSVQLNPRTQKLDVCITIHPEPDRRGTEFKYRDPYACVPEITAEILAFYVSAPDSSGD